MSDDRLIVFAKAPTPGRVNTRLMPRLTAQQAAAVHEACLMDVVRRARATHGHVSIRYDDAPGSSAFFAEAFPDLERRPQARGDLGNRLERTFAEEFEGGAERVVIIGTDSPTLPESELRDAIGALITVDIVLGPAADGGYYLVAVRRRGWPAARVLFTGIPWSSDRVLAETIRRLAGTGLDADLLTPWYDIDRPGDLRLAAVHAAPDSRLGRLLATELAGALAPSPTRSVFP